MEEEQREEQEEEQGGIGALRQASPQSIYNLWSSALRPTHSLRHISERLSGKTLFWEWEGKIKLG